MATIRRFKSIVKKSLSQEWASRFVDKINLAKLRLRAMRSGVWYKALNRIDRVLVDLTIKVIKNNVRSVSLLTQLLTVTTKIESLLENKLSRATREYGLPLANKLSQLAQKWGNKTARSWSSDLAFAKYLAVHKLNNMLPT